MVPSSPVDNVLSTQWRPFIRRDRYPGRWTFGESVVVLFDYARVAGSREEDYYSVKYYSFRLEDGARLAVRNSSQTRTRAAI